MCCKKLALQYITGAKSVPFAWKKKLWKERVELNDTMQLQQWLVMACHQWKSQVSSPTLLSSTCYLHLYRKKDLRKHRVAGRFHHFDTMRCAASPGIFSRPWSAMRQCQQQIPGPWKHLQVSHSPNSFSYRGSYFKYSWGLCWCNFLF